MDAHLSKPTAFGFPPVDILRMRTVVRGIAAASDLDAMLAIVAGNGPDGVPPCCALLAGVNPQGSIDIWAHHQIPHAVLATAPVPADIGFPMTEAIASGTPIWIESRKDRDRWYPGLDRFEDPPSAAGLLPLEVDGKVIGGLGVFFAHDHPFIENERQHYELLADLVALGTARVRGSGEATTVEG